MLSSIGGQNERWAQIAAVRPASPAQAGESSGPVPGKAGTTTSDLPPIGPVAGSTGSPLSSDTSFLLTVLGGAAQSANRPGPTGPPIRDQTGAQSATAPQGVSSTIAQTAAGGVTEASLVKELQALVSPGATVTFASGGVAPPAATRSGPANAIGDSDTAVPSWRNGWDGAPGQGDVQRQQTGLAAYASADGQTSAAASVLQGVTA